MSKCYFLLYQIFLNHLIYTLPYLNFFLSIKEYNILHPCLSISISFFTSGEELLENIKQQGRYDLFFLDIVMPGMNGITLGNTLRKQGIHEPIIYLTSSEEYAI